MSGNTTPLSARPNTSASNWVPSWVRNDDTPLQTEDASPPDLALPPTGKDEAQDPTPFSSPTPEEDKPVEDKPALVHQPVLPPTPTYSVLPMSPALRGAHHIPHSQASRVLVDTSFDLVSPDGRVVGLTREDRKTLRCEISITDISPQFLGWCLGPNDRLSFNLKSTLSQLGLHSVTDELVLDKETRSASCVIRLVAIATMGVLALDFVEMGTQLGKLFAVCAARRVHHEQYIRQLKGRTTRFGDPLLVYGAQDEEDWELEERDGRLVAFIKLKPGAITYDFEITGFLPTVGKALRSKSTTHIRPMLRLHQNHKGSNSRYAREGDMLMVRSKAMHIHTMFARVVDELLPPGIHCTSASVLEPYGSSEEETLCGRTFVFYGDSDKELDRIPIEFYTVEPYREGIAFEDRTALNKLLMNFEEASAAFATAPTEHDVQACVYICKGSQMSELTESSWITSRPQPVPYVGSVHPQQQLSQARQYLVQQCQYGLLKAIAQGEITSQGVLLTKYFISPILKHFLLSGYVCQCVRAIYFLEASQSTGSFFSQSDRAMLQDLMLFGVRVYHVDVRRRQIFQYVHRMGTDSGMFVPMGRKEEYLRAFYVGVYGSNLVEGDFESDLKTVFSGLKQIVTTSPNPEVSQKGLCVVTGGGPGIMELGNRVAHNLGILSCGLFVDFGAGKRKAGVVINEQKQNSFVDAWMTYRLEKLVERQSDFNLDFPIICVGGVGTDFEYALEEVRRKIGTTPPNPILIFGPKKHWKEKITPRWRANLEAGVVKGSEWLSNVVYLVHSGEDGLEVYRRFFAGTLRIGASHPSNLDGFIEVNDEFWAQ